MLVLSHLRWDEADFAETEAKSRDLRLLPDLRMPAFHRRVSTPAASVEPSRRWRNARSVEERRDFRAHEFEEHTNTPSAVEMHESTKGFGEWPRQNANLLANLNLKVGVEANSAATSVSTIPCGTGIGCSSPMIGEATPKALLTQRHWSLERSR